jgi:hypothetical protein
MHPGVTELGPQILNGIESDEGSDEKSDKFDAADAADTQASHKHPEEPLRLEAVVSLVVELGPTERSCDSTTQKHGVEEDETADGGVRVFTQNHKGNQPDSGTLQFQFSCGKVCQWDANNTKSGVEGSHEGIVDFLGVFLARFEFE